MRKEKEVIIYEENINEFAMDNDSLRNYGGVIIRRIDSDSSGIKIFKYF